MNHVKYHDYTRGGGELPDDEFWGLMKLVNTAFVTGIMLGVFVSAVVLLVVRLLS